MNFERDIGALRKLDIGRYTEDGLVRTIEEALFKNSFFQNYKHGEINEKCIYSWISPNGKDYICLMEYSEGEDDFEDKRKPVDHPKFKKLYYIKQVQPGVISRTSLPKFFEDFEINL